MPHRNALLEKLRSYQPLDEKDRQQASRIIEFVKTNPLCFERSLLTGHVTGSGWIVNENGTRVLLTEHRKLGKWLQLGGHADGEEDVLHVALREAREESGLTKIEPVMPDIFDVDVHEIPEHTNEPRHYHYDIRFLLEASEAEPLKTSAESIRLAWVSLDKIDRYTEEESILRMARKWLARVSERTFQPEVE